MGRVYLPGDENFMKQRAKGEDPRFLANLCSGKPRDLICTILFAQRWLCDYFDRDTRSRHEGCPLLRLRRENPFVLEALGECLMKESPSLLPCPI